MSSFTSTDPTIKPTVNFTVRNGVDTKIEQPIGEFIEELMYAINLELASISLPEFQFSIYDIVNDDDPQDAEKHDGWVIDTGGSGEVWRIDFTPAPPFQQTLGFHSFVRNYIKDIALGLTELLQTGWGDIANKVSETNGHSVFNLFSNLGSGTLDDRISAIAGFVASIPESDDNLNILTPKLCMANVTDETLQIHDILGPALEASTGQSMGPENLVCEWKYKDENGQIVSGAVGGVFFGTKIYISFSDGTLRAYNVRSGFPEVLTGGAGFSVSLFPVPENLGITNYGLSYVSGGQVFSIDFVSGSQLRKVFYFPDGGEVLGQFLFPQSSVALEDNELTGFTGILSGNKLIMDNEVMFVEESSGNFKFIKTFDYGDDATGSFISQFPVSLRLFELVFGIPLTWPGRLESLVLQNGVRKGFSIISNENFTFNGLNEPGNWLINKVDSVLSLLPFQVGLGKSFTTGGEQIERRFIKRLNIGLFDKVVYGTKSLDFYFQAEYWANVLPLVERTIKVYHYIGAKPPVIDPETQFNALGDLLGTFTIPAGINRFDGFHAIKDLDVEALAEPGPGLDRVIWLIYVAETNLIEQDSGPSTSLRGSVDGYHLMIKNDWKG